MNTPSTAAKAAALMHNTWGIDSYSLALEIYNVFESDDTILVVDYLEEYNAGIWGELENLSELEWWENVVALAQSIDAAQAWAQTETGESK